MLRNTSEQPTEHVKGREPSADMDCGLPRGGNGRIRWRTRKRHTEQKLTKDDARFGPLSKIYTRQENGNAKEREAEEKDEVMHFLLHLLRGQWLLSESEKRAEPSRLRRLQTKAQGKAGPRE